jgi:membrane protease subunit HflC
MKKIPWPTLLTATIVVAVLLVYMFTYQVRFSEVAVKVRFGKVVGIVGEPGLGLRWPWPIETIKKYDVRLRVLDTLESEIKTKDGKNIIVGNYALWRIKDPLKFHNVVKTVPAAEETLRARIDQRRVAVVGNVDLSAFVNLDQEAVNASYDALEHALLRGQQETGTGASLQDAVLNDFGIELVKVDIRRVSLPEETTRSVFEQMVAERQAEAARFREAGKSRAESITARAESDAKQILAFANRKAAEIEATGIEAATTILEQIEREDAEFFEWLRWLDALKVALRERSTIFLDSSSDLFRHFQAPVPLEAGPIPDAR